MKTKAIGHRSRVRLFAIVIVATCAFAAAANAQSSFTGKFTLPYEVHWGATVLPPGEYSIRMDSKSAPALVWSTGGGTEMFTPIPTTDGSEKGAARIVVSVRGNERMIRSLNLPQLGTSFVYKPFTKAERELLAKAGQIETVPVMVARK